LCFLEERLRYPPKLARSHARRQPLAKPFPVDQPAWLRIAADDGRERRCLHLRRGALESVDLDLLQETHRPRGDITADWRHGAHPRADQPRQLWQKLKRGDEFILVDALTPISYAHPHLPGAVNLPPEWVDDRGPRRIPDPDTEVVVYCASSTCDSSVIVANRLIKARPPKRQPLRQGNRDWIEAGLPLEGGGIGLGSGSSRSGG
jgi:rhodanese-related sulfurtransferase